MNKNIFILILIQFLFISSCTEWKIIEGDYDPASFVPRQLYRINGMGLFCGASQGLFKVEAGKVVKIKIDVEDTKVPRAFVKKDSFLFVGYQGGGLFRSDDNGMTWIRKGEPGLQSRELWNIAAFDSLLIVVTWPRYIRLSYDNGESWEDISEGMPEYGMGVFSGQPGMLKRGDYIYANLYNEGVFRMNLKDKIWKPVRSGLPKDYKIRGLCIKENTFFCATEDGVYKSDDEGMNWVPSNKGNEKTMIVSFLVDKKNLYATTNTGSVLVSSDNGKAWRVVAKGLQSAQVIYDIQKINKRLYVSADGVKKASSGIYSMKVKK